MPPRRVARTNVNAIDIVRFLLISLYRIPKALQGPRRGSPLSCISSHKVALNKVSALKARRWISGVKLSSDTWSAIQPACVSLVKKWDDVYANILLSCMNEYNEYDVYNRCS